MIQKFKELLSTKENIIKFAYSCATFLSALSFGFLFLNLYSDPQFKGNAFIQAFRSDTNSILIMIALLLVIATFTWNMVCTILLFIPKTSKYLLTVHEEDENSRLYSIIHLSVFGVLALYAGIIFFLAILIITNGQYVGLSVSTFFQGFFALLSIAGTGFASCICNYSLFIPKDFGSIEWQEKKAKKEKRSNEADTSSTDW